MLYPAEIVFFALFIATEVSDVLTIHENKFNWWFYGLVIGFVYAVAGFIF